MAAQTAHFKGEGGVIWQMDLPLTEVLREKVTKGYLRRVNPDGSPYTEPEESADDAAGGGELDGVTERPPQSAPKAEWVGWAVHNGMSPDDAEGLTKQDLIDRYGKD